jgi:hypothetical protein
VILGTTVSIDPGVFIGLGGVAAALVTAFVSWRKTGSETTKILVDASKDVVLIQRGEVERMAKTIQELRLGLAEAAQQIAQCQRDNEELRIKIRELERSQT